jgi:hypothetical protein
MPPW